MAYGKDVVHYSINIPGLPVEGRVIYCIENGGVVKAIMWDPRKCPKTLVSAIDRVLVNSPNDLPKDSADRAAWEYFTGGPDRVRYKFKLDDRFACLTRSSMGFIEFPTDCASVFFMDGTRTYPPEDDDEDNNDVMSDD